MKLYFQLLMMGCSLFFCSFACKKQIIKEIVRVGQDSTATKPEEIAIICKDTLPNTFDFKGVNWADARDNFVNGLLAPTGLDTLGSLSDALINAKSIISGFKSYGINTLRLPVNPVTVSTANWWNIYSNVIDYATTQNMKVLLAYWEADSSKDGLVDDMTAFLDMWKSVTDRFANNCKVYYEVMNEPHGYSSIGLVNVYAKWLNTFKNIAQTHIILDGIGYANNVNDVGDDDRFSHCLLSYHNYTWFASSTTTVEWESPILAFKYPSRTLITEFGVDMTTGTDFSIPTLNNRSVTYMQGITNAARTVGIGSIYWPGIRSQDAYSMFTWTNNQVNVVNRTGLHRLQYGWGTVTEEPFYGAFDATAKYKIICRNSGLALDVNGQSKLDNAKLIQYTYSGGTNQQWQFVSAGNNNWNIVNVNSQKAIGILNGANTAGQGIVQYAIDSSSSWQIINVGFGYYTIKNVKSGLSLDISGASASNGANVIQWLFNGGKNQQWMIEKL